MPFSNLLLLSSVRVQNISLLLAFVWAEPVKSEKRMEK
mgnify:CR=1 FL=1